MKLSLLLLALPVQLLAQEATTQPIVLPTEPVCGDGLKEGLEQCDDGSQNSPSGPCLPGCLLAPVLSKEPICGNRMLEEGEVCDDGNTQNRDGCRADCRGRESCGDALLDANEACDDGNNKDNDGCSADCQTASICGNGAKELGELCDDGNTLDGDGCNADCRGFEPCHEGFSSFKEGCESTFFLKLDRPLQPQQPISPEYQKSTQRAFRLSAYTTAASVAGGVAGFVAPRIFVALNGDDPADIGPGGFALLFGSRALLTSGIFGVMLGPSIGHYMLNEYRRGTLLVVRRGAALAFASLGYSLATSVINPAPGTVAIEGLGLASAIVLPIMLIRHTNDIRYAAVRAAAKRPLQLE